MEWLGEVLHKVRGFAPCQLGKVGPRKFENSSLHAFAEMGLSDGAMPNPTGEGALCQAKFEIKSGFHQFFGLKKTILRKAR